MQCPDLDNSSVMNGDASLEYTVFQKWKGDNIPDIPPYIFYDKDNCEELLNKFGIN